jgi:hypothetical protein
MKALLAHKRLAAVVALVSISLITVVVWCGYPVGVYAEVQPGMPYGEVEELLGPPAPFFTAEPLLVAKDLWDDPNTNLILSWDRGELTFFIAFDKDRRVVDKRWYVGRSRWKTNTSTRIRDRVERLF